MKQTKRILSVLICLAMVLSLLSVVSFAATPSTLYLKPNSNWTEANARFAAYFFGNGEKWDSMTDSNGDGIYEVEVPSGFSKVIFCRMNPGTSANNWNNKWNQTGDLNIPTDDKNLFTVADGSWDGATTSWGTYTPPTCDHAGHGQDGLCPKCGPVEHRFVEHVCICGLVEPMIAEPGYYLVGSFNGDSWFVNETSADRLMTEIEDGVFEIVYNFAAGELFKIVSYDGYAIGTWYGAAQGGDDQGNYICAEEGELTLHFEEAHHTAYFYHGCDHVEHDADGFCVNCGEEVGHSYEGNVCPGCGNEIEQLVIFFRNDWNWSDVKIYYWGSVVPSVDWPGEAMYEYEGNIYSYVIPVDVDGFKIHGLDGEAEKDTGDIVENIAEGNCYYMNWTEELGEHVCVITIDEALNPPCDHAEHDQNGFCLSCGETVEHNYSDGFCSCGAADPDYIPPCEHANHDVDGNCVDCGEYVGHSFDENYACACGKTIETVTVYFQNNWLWREVSIFFWGSELADPVWPGYSMEFYDYDGLYDVYSYNIPVDVDGVIINGKKDDGSNTLDQTPDIKEGFYDGICYYMTWDNGNAVGSLNVEQLFCEHENHDQEGNCTNCGTAVEHVYEAVVTNPDCVNGGYTTYTCACGSEYTADETDPVHAEIIHVEAVAADCYNNGNIEYWYCGLCGQAWLDAECTLNTNLKAVVLPMAHAEIIHVEAVAADCYNNGNIEYWYCETCGQAWLDAECTLNTNLKAVVLPMAHAEIIHVEAVAADCENNGNIEYWYCGLCGQAWLDAECTLNTNLKAVILPASGHTADEVPGYDADCENDGLTDGSICGTCGTTLTAQEPIPAYGHDYVDGICGTCGGEDPDYEAPAEPEPPVAAPTKVEGLKLADSTRTSITLSWDALIGATNYWVFVDGAAYSCTTGTTLTITGRQVATSYSVYVLANIDNTYMLSAADADVITVATKNYEFSSEVTSSGKNITVDWTAEDCDGAWMLYGSSEDSLVVYDFSANGPITKANLKNGTYYAQVAYLFQGKVVYGEIMEIEVTATAFIPV